MSDIIGIDFQGDRVWVTHFGKTHKLHDKKNEQIKSDYLRIARKYESRFDNQFQSDK